LLISHSDSIRILNYEKQKDFETSICFLENKKISVKGGFLKNSND